MKSRTRFVFINVFLVLVLATLVYNRFCKIQHLKKSRSGYP